MNDVKNKLVIITGPTASGKTALALKLAKKFHGEIISADSRQVYRGMDIGTAKSRAPQHLIDIRNPNQSYTLAHFQQDTKKLIKQIRKRGHIPFLVGGTPFYINALVNNLQIPEVKPNPKLRAKLEKLSAVRLFAMLKARDRTRAKTIDHLNKRRLIRALEIVHALSHVPSVNSLSRPGEGQGEVEILILGLKQSNSSLRRSINHRTEAMFRTGLVREVKNLVRKYGRQKKFLTTIGYHEVIEHLEGKLTLEQAKQQIKNHTWQYTRRQLTWFRKMPIHWVSSTAPAARLLKKI